ncbi:hypothetical protein J437_LFUL011328, partial [Ladona fulva]
MLLWSFAVKMLGCLSGKIALVTGAGSGIGRAACIALYRDGATIIAADRNLNSAKATVELIAESKKDSIPMELNVMDSANIKKMFQEVKRHFSQPPSVIVNSAGITKDNFILKMDESDFDEVINVNLKGTFLMIQAAGQALVEANMGGSIVNLASIVGVRGNIGQGNYSASKAGVEALTKTTAKEFGKFGIRCNAVVPGFIESPMTETVPDKVKEMFRSQIPLARFGKPSGQQNCSNVKVAELIAFLASDKSSYINGTSVE